MEKFLNNQKELLEKLLEASNEYNPAYIPAYVNPAYIPTYVNPAYITAYVNPAYIPTNVKPAYIPAYVNPAYIPTNVKSTSQKEYTDTKETAKDKIIIQLKSEMLEAAKGLNFEKAAALRDLILKNESGCK